MFGERNELVEVRREEHQRSLIFQTQQELANGLRDRQAVDGAGSAANLID